MLHGSEDLHVGVEYPHRVYETLQCPQTLKIFEPSEGGSAHVQWDNLHAAHRVMFPWLVETLAAGIAGR